MQLASHGLRALKGTQAHLFPPGGGSSRSIHIPALAPRAAHPTTTQAAVKYARTLASRFFAHLTAPGTLRAPIPAGTAPRAFHNAARMPTIQQRLSGPARHILSRPLAAPFLPRAPVVPRTVTQVGFGTARNFSSGRPIFQHLIENVPVYARAFTEADWDVRIEEERERMRIEKYKARQAAKAMKKVQTPLRPIQISVVPTPAESAVEAQEAELEHYFPAAKVPEVTTYLLIPLAPTPTSRHPLPANPSTSMAHPLLPLGVVASMHQTHGTHALRVNTIFARLDTAQVFDNPNVHCEARGDPSGLATILEVRFDGWTASAVRGIIGEAGQGWCVLDEVWAADAPAEAAEVEAALDALSTPDTDTPLSLSGLSGLDASWGASEDEIDPASSFVLPTLDFSASFPVPSSWPAPAPVSELEMHNAWTEVYSRASSPMGFESDADSDLGSADSDWHEVSGARGSSTSGRWVGFSSQFSERMGAGDGPREELF